MSGAKRRAEQRILDMFLKTLRDAQLDLERMPAPVDTSADSESEPKFDWRRLSEDEQDIWIDLIHKGKGTPRYIGHAYHSELVFGRKEWRLLPGTQTYYQVQEMIWGNVPDRATLETYARARGIVEPLTATQGDAQGKSEKCPPAESQARNGVSNGG